MFSLFISGLVLGSGPCLSSCGPILISYITATRQGPRQGILVWLSFSLSRICAYLALSLGIFLLGEFLVRQNLMYVAKHIYFFGGLIIVLIGILVIVRDAFGSARICSIISERINRRLVKVHPFTLGLIIGLLPCAPLIAVLSYIGLVSIYWQRCIIYSLSFGLGTLISPLLPLAWGAGWISKILFNQPGTYRILRIICGFIIVFLGSQLILKTGYGPFILP